MNLLWRRSLSNRNQSIDLQSKFFDWFLYHRDIRHERVKRFFFKVDIYGGIEPSQFVIFKSLSYCFKEKIEFDVKVTFASRPVSRLIRWYNKPGDITKEFEKRLFSSTGLFMDWKWQTDHFIFIISSLTFFVLFYSFKKETSNKKQINDNKIMLIKNLNKN